MNATELKAIIKPVSPATLPDDSEYFLERALLAAIVESSDDAIVSKTLEGCILSWNRGATRIFGYEAIEMIGKAITIIVPPELYEEEQQILEKLRGGERIDHFDTIRVTKDGRRIAISLTVSPIRAADGTVIGASKVARDISERKEAEHALQRSYEVLRQADRRKDEVLALLAHELRNPLALIPYALAANKKPGRTREELKQTEEIIERQVSHMSRLLDDLLDVSRIKQHTLALELPNQPVRLEADLVRLVPKEMKQTVHGISRGYENVFRWLAEKWRALGTFDLATMSDEESTYFIDAVELVLKRLVP
jgi:PAS domain S-box-containing protein